MLGEALTPKFGQTFGTFVRSEGPCVALYNRAVVCENYSVITVSLVSQSSAINLSVEMRILNTKSAPGKYHNCSKCASQIPNTKGAPGKYHNCALNIYVVALHLLHILPEQKYRERCDQRSVDTFNKFHRKFNQLCWIIVNTIKGNTNAISEQKWLSGQLSNLKRRITSHEHRCIGHFWLRAEFCKRLPTDAIKSALAQMVRRMMAMIIKTIIILITIIITMIFQLMRLKCTCTLAQIMIVWMIVTII